MDLISPITRRRSAPAEVTRLVLATDGSTTAILEALLRCSLTVRVDAQEWVSPGEVPAPIAAALRLVRGHDVIERKSALVTPGGTVVSVNSVYFAAPPRGWSGSAQDPAPLGRRLREAGTRQHREILAWGTAVWPDERWPKPCAFKEYVIDCEDGVRLHLTERFNPRMLAVPNGSAGTGHGLDASHRAGPAHTSGPAPVSRSAPDPGAVGGPRRAPGPREGAHPPGTTATTVVLPSLT